MFYILQLGLNLDYFDNVAIKTWYLNIFDEGFFPKIVWHKILLHSAFEEIAFYCWDKIEYIVDR